MGIKIRIPIYFLHHTNNKIVVDVMGTNVGECMQSLSAQFEGFKQIVADGFYNIYMMDKYSSFFSIGKLELAFKILISLTMDCSMINSVKCI